MSTRLSPDEIRLRAMTEATWQATVVGLATALGWRVYHPPKAGVRANGSVRATVPGFPDLTMVRGARLVFAELKRQGPAGRLKPEQVAWLTALAATGAEVWTWRPGDLEQVKTVLR